MFDVRSGLMYPFIKSNKTIIFSISWFLADLQGQCWVELQVRVHNDWIYWFMKRACSMGDVPRGTAPTPHFDKPKVKQNQATQTYPLHCPCF